MVYIVYMTEERGVGGRGVTLASWGSSRGFGDVEIVSILSVLILCDQDGLVEEQAKGPR